MQTILIEILHLIIATGTEHENNSKALLDRVLAAKFQLHYSCLLSRALNKYVLDLKTSFSNFSSTKA